MNEKGRGISKCVPSVLITILFLVGGFSGIVSNAEATDVQLDFIQQQIVETGIEYYNETDNESTIPGKLAKNWFEVSNFVASASVVYLNQDTTLTIEVQSTAGDAGDDDYFLSISNVKVDIAELLATTNKKSAKIQLGKAIDELDAAMASVQNNQRLASLENVKKAITFLGNAGKMGVDTSDVISDLIACATYKVETVINEATSNFGSAHPDVENASVLYDTAISKFNAGKYNTAMVLLMDALEMGLGAYECNVYITVIDIIPKQSETLIAEPVILNLTAEASGTVEVYWHPTQRGVHYIKLNITGEYEIYSSPGELAKSPPTIMSVGFPVAPLGAEEYWDTPELRTIDPNDPVNNPGGYRNRTGPLTIFLQSGNLSIKSGGTLLFNDNVTFVIENPEVVTY